MEKSEQERALKEFTLEEQKDLEVIARTLQSDPDYEKKKKKQRARAN